MPQAILLVNDGSDRAVSWDRQFSSPLTDEFRVISVDIGEDGRLGLAAVIDQRGLDGIVIVGWSRSIRAIIEYLRVDGQDAVAGLGFVDWGQEFVDATGVLSALLVPVLLSNRSQDQTLPTTTRDRILAACLTARESVYDGQRPPFVEDPVRFNLELADFVARANRDRPARAPARSDRRGVSNLSAVQYSRRSLGLRVTTRPVDARRGPARWPAQPTGRRPLPRARRDSLRREGCGRRAAPLRRC